jgi:hypothetical protein
MSPEAQVRVRHELSRDVSNLEVLRVRIDSCPVVI